MTTLATITINAPATALDKQHQETQYIQRAMEIAKIDIRSNGGKKTSGTMTDDRGVVLGTWSYTPVASS
jgi:hypothetical protein